MAGRVDVFVVFLPSHPDPLQVISKAEQQYQIAAPERADDLAKGQVIAALRRRFEELKHI